MKRARITEQALQTCLAIHQQVLLGAEVVRDPAALYLQEMLQRSAGDSEHWRTSWQTYLLQRLDTASPVHYQQSILLWLMLFLEADEVEQVAQHVLHHYQNGSLPQQTYSLRFLTTLSRDLSDLRYLRYLSDLRSFLLTEKVAEKASLSLDGATPSTTIDYLTLIMGRLLQMPEAGEPEMQFQEIQKLIRKTLTCLAVNSGNDEIAGAVADGLRSLPARTANEIHFVRQNALEIPDKRLRRACVKALATARPRDEQAWEEVKRCQASTDVEIQRVAKTVLKRRERSG